MKLRGISSSLALLFSLILNAGILLFGLKLYQSQKLELSQVAGSQVSTTVFTMTIIANFSMSESETVSKKSEGLKSEVAEKTQEKSPEIREEMREELIVVSDNSEVKVSLTKMPEILSDESMIENLQAEREKVESAERESSEAFNETSIKPAPDKPKLEELANNQNKRQNETQNSSQASQARSGDEFTAALSDRIHAQIEGCYPEASKRRGEEGVVKLQIIKDQSRLSVELLHSSGFKRLDRCAVSAVEKLLKTIPIDDVPATGMHLKPIRFQLR